MVVNVVHINMLTARSKLYFFRWALRSRTVWKESDRTTITNFKIMLRRYSWTTWGLSATIWNILFQSLRILQRWYHLVIRDIVTAIFRTSVISKKKYSCRYRALVRSDKRDLLVKLRKHIRVIRTKLWATAYIVTRREAQAFPVDQFTSKLSTPTARPYQ